MPPDAGHSTRRLAEAEIHVGLTSTELAAHLHISVPRVNDIVCERRAITADTAMRLTGDDGGAAADLPLG